MKPFGLANYARLSPSNAFTTLLQRKWKGEGRILVNNREKEGFL
jgi:hypothetical protein